MNDIFNLKVNKVIKRGKVTILDNYVIKKNDNNYYDYLSTTGFKNFPEVIDTKDGYILTKYIEDKEIPINQRLEDMIYLVSILHNNTSYNKEIDIDTIKKIYEDTILRQDKLMKYYLGLQNVIENEEYMLPADYLLIRNISLIYMAIKESRKYLDKWYKIKEQNKNIRYSYVHGNLDVSHLLESNSFYLISWDKSRLDLPISDIEDFYRKNFRNIKLTNLLNIYRKKGVLKDDELFLLFSYLLIPVDIDLSKDRNEYLKVKDVTYMILYLEDTLDSLKKYSIEHDSKTNQQ